MSMDFCYEHQTFKVTPCCEARAREEEVCCRRCQQPVAPEQFICLECDNTEVMAA